MFTSSCNIDNEPKTQVLAIFLPPFQYSMIYICSISNNWSQVGLGHWFNSSKPNTLKSTMSIHIINWRPSLLVVWLFKIGTSDSSDAIPSVLVQWSYILPQTTSVFCIHIPKFIPEVFLGWSMGTGLEIKTRSKRWICISLEARYCSSQIDLKITQIAFSLVLSISINRVKWWNNLSQGVLAGM